MPAMHEGPKWKVLRGHLDRVWCLCLTGEAESQLLYTGSEDGTVICWNAQTCEQRRQYRGHKGAVTAITVVDDHLLSASSDRTVIYWSPKGEQLKVFSSFHEPVRSLACLGDVLAAGEADGALQLLSLGGEGSPIQVDAHFDTVSFLAFHQTEEAGLQLFSASYDKLVRSWEPTTGKCVTVFRGHDNHVKCLAFAGTTLYSGSRDDTVRLWNLMTGAQLAVLRLPTLINAVTLLHDNLYCGCSDGRVRVLLQKPVQGRLAKYQAGKTATFTAKKKELEGKCEKDIAKMRRQMEAKLRALMPQQHEEVEEEAEDAEDGQPPAAAPPPAPTAALHLDEAQLQELQDNLTHDVDRKAEQLRIKVGLQVEALAKDRDQPLEVPAAELADGKSPYVHVLPYDGPSVLALSVAGKAMFVAADNEVVKTSPELNVVHL